jgi:hypothetical protein
MQLAKSSMVFPVAARIFAMLSVDGQRGCPNLLHLFDRLKVVGSRPLCLASPEHVSF